MLIFAIIESVFGKLNTAWFPAVLEDHDLCLDHDAYCMQVNL